MLEYNLKGNIGDRDNFIYNNYSFLIIEGQGTKNNFGTWNCFFYNENIDKAIPIQFKTHHNSQNFANPTIYFTSINNRPIVLITVFIPTDNSGKQEDRELIYYKYL
ncbi:MAG: hypothetical protein R2801_09440 [Chitinophagales bacterium]